MQYKLVSLLALCLTFSLASSDCLPEDTLKDIGFDSAQGVAVVSEPIVCTDLFGTTGTCVPEASVIAKIEADNDKFKSSVNIFADISTSMNDLANVVKEESEEDKEIIENILKNTENSKDNCINAWSVVQQGITCFLASGEASTHVSVGAKLTVNVDRNVIGPYLESCLDYIDTICLLTAGMSISSSVTVSDEAFLSNSAEYKSSCETLRDNYSCSTDECKATKYDTIINVFFKPYNYGFFPSNNVFTNISNKLKDIADSVGEWFSDLFSRNLMEEEDVETRSSSNGSDPKKHGNNSNQEKVTESAPVFSMVVLAVIAFIVA